MSNINASKIDAYKQILDELEFLHSQGLLESSVDYRHSFGGVIQRIEIAEMFNIAISEHDPCSATSYKVGNYAHICKYGAKYDRTISWSDDGTQPEDEWLYCLSFPTGAYIFGQDYPVETFQKMFAELKTFIPKYSDTANKSLYYTKETAHTVNKVLTSIIKKYRDASAEEVNRKRVAELEKQIAKIKLWEL